jgi:hypothetical protein
MNEIDEQVQYNIESNIWPRMKQQIETEVFYQVGIKVWEQVRNKIYMGMWIQTRGQVEKKLQENSQHDQST